MKVYETETLIIGAGPAGLACAMELMSFDRDFMVIERDSVPGGLSKTYSFVEADGSVFLTDNGPHRFFSKNPKLYDLLGGVLGEDWISVKRSTRQYIGGKYYRYPIDPLQALRNVGLVEAVRMMAGYLFARARRLIRRAPVSNFEEYINAHFGRRLGRFCMINYTEKIWGIPAATIHPDWARQRISGLNLIKAVTSFVSKASGRSTASLVDTFFYPRNGAGHAYEKMTEILRGTGREVVLGCEAVKIRSLKKGFEVTARIGTEKVLVRCSFVVQSMPIKYSLSILDPKPPARVTKSVSRLSYRSQVYLFITIDKPSLTPDQWIYFPEKSVPFGRVSEMRNFSATMSPAGKTSLFVEFFCTEGDSVWTSSADELMLLAMPHFEKMGLFRSSDVRNVYLLRQKDAYPVYDLSYEEYANAAKSHLDSIDGMFAIGRPGRFRYNNQDHSLEMGILAARSIVEGVRHDLDSVGSEGEYYEKGSHKTSA